jgi:hypothetical protein
MQCRAGTQHGTRIGFADGGVGHPGGTCAGEALSGASDSVLPRPLLAAGRISWVTPKRSMQCLKVLLG